MRALLPRRSRMEERIFRLFNLQGEFGLQPFLFGAPAE